MKSEVIKLIEKSLKDYKTKTIRISEREYPLYIVPNLCDEDLNIFEGFLLAEAESKSEVSYLKSKYRPPVSGYAPRIGLIFYDGHLLIKDYRRNRHIIKTLHKINKTFVNKLKKALTHPTEENFNKLFDRTDVIDEFYILFKKSREYLLKNISGITEEEKREEFVDNFMMQMLTLWYLQERGFFNNDKNYFITKFTEITQKKLFGNEFKNYYEFLTYFFDKISNNLGEQYYEDDKVGRVVVVGPAVFINGEQKKAISIPDKCFYKEGLTNILINTPPKKVGDDVPLLNLFESRDWTEGNIDEFVLGAIYEKLITYMERKKLGAYYTPEEITSYICKNTIEPYLMDKINERFVGKFETIDQVIESNDKDILLYLFEQLKEIKILDPAVGSGHFLESAINVLLSIYEKIWEKAREIGLRKGFTILASNEKGEIEQIELLSISSEEKFRLLVKFFIILSKNIYGVDINPSALKVARARLFLTLAKHFKVGKEKDVFVRFPNVHFNLRAGNSLIGYVKPEKERPKALTLFDFVKEERADYIVEKIKVVAELKPYLEKTAKNLKIDGDIVKEVETLNEILSKKSIDWNDFEKVLRTKEKLIKILIASLNSQYAVPLNELLREITDLFNQKLDEKFAEEHDIKLEDLKKIKTFHWFFEFPEVFLDRGGFDIVIGNPPYGDILKEFEKKLLIQSGISKDTTKNIFAYFIIRGFSLLKLNGILSMIIPNVIGRIYTFTDLRKFILNDTVILEIKQEGAPFIGVDMEMYTIILKKEKKANYKVKISSQIIKDVNNYVLIDVFRKYNRFILWYDNLFEYIWGTSKINLLVSKRGPDKDHKPEKIDNYNIPFLYSHGSLDKYYIKNYEFTNNNFKQDAYFISSRNRYRIYRCVINPGFRVGAGIAIIRFKDKNTNQDKYKSLMIILNSKLMDFLMYKYVFNFDTKPSNLQKDVLEFTPLKFFKMDLHELADYLLFLSATEERRQKLKDLIEFFDRRIADSLVYELYFKEKFHEDGLYPEPKEYLLEAVSKHLKPINYDRWAELYWKRQLEENLTSEELKELEELEKENLNTVDEVYKSLKEDKEVQNWIKKIKSHEWVRII